MRDRLRRDLRIAELPDSNGQLNDESLKRAVFSKPESDALDYTYRILLQDEASLLYSTWGYQQSASLDLLLIAQRLCQGIDQLFQSRGVTNA